VTDQAPDLCALPKGFEFHHMGYATTSMERERVQFAALGYRQDGPEFIDPVQGVAGCFLCGPGPCIELLENLPDSHTLTPWLNAGVRIYHSAYLVDNLEDANAWIRTMRAKVIASPVPAVAFQGRRICFAMLRNQWTIELIEKPIAFSQLV